MHETLPNYTSVWHAKGTRARLMNVWLCIVTRSMCRDKYQNTQPNLPEYRRRSHFSYRGEARESFLICGWFFNKRRWCSWLGSHAFPANESYAVCTVIIWRITARYFIPQTSEGLDPPGERKRWSNEGQTSFYECNKSSASCFMLLG